jgi:hypothetical protein
MIAWSGIWACSDGLPCVTEGASRKFACECPPGTHYALKAGSSSQSECVEDAKSTDSGSQSPPPNDQRRDGSARGGDSATANADADDPSSQDAAESDATGNEDVTDGGPASPQTDASDGTTADSAVSKVDAGKGPTADAAMSKVDASNGPTADSATSMPDAGGEEPPSSKVEGSAIAANCSSYGTAKNGMCGGYYCGITLEDLASEFKPGNKCDITPAKTCDGQLTRDFAKCARDTKSNPANAFDSDEQIRAKVATCVKMIAANADLAAGCLSCFLDAEQCASNNCLTTCLSGDGPSCDKCRLDNNCNQPVSTCVGLPTPF